MLPALTRKWWLLLLDGLCVLALGVLAFSAPDAASLVVLAACGMYWLIDSVLSTVLAISVRRARSNLSVAILSGGIVSITIAVCTLGWPNIGASTLVLSVGLWAILHGVCEILIAIRLRKLIHGEWLFHFLGSLSIAFGAYLLARPLLGAVLWIWMLGAFALVRGVTTCIIAFELREIRRIHATLGQLVFSPPPGR